MILGPARLVDKTMYCRGSRSTSSWCSPIVHPHIDRHTVMLFDAVSVRPVSTEILFPGQLVQNSSGAGASLDTLIPAIPSWPEGAYASVVTMQSTLGPEHLTYFHRVHGVRTPYRPVGMAVPGVCPRRGYRFVVHVGFLDGSSATAASHVPCHR